MRRKRPRLASIDLGISLGGLFTAGTTWTPNRAESEASWELLVELVTRTATVGLADDHGTIREALTSLHQLFGETRAILRRGGPDVAPNRDDGDPTLGVVAVRILNEVLRPFLNDWHPRLKAFEDVEEAAGRVVDEAAWPDAQACRSALRDVRVVLRDYVETLARAAGTEAFAETIAAEIHRGPD